jgi:hypothetical protein
MERGAAYVLSECLVVLPARLPHLKNLTACVSFCNPPRNRQPAIQASCQGFRCLSYEWLSTTLLSLCSLLSVCRLDMRGDQGTRRPPRILGVVQGIRSNQGTWSQTEHMVNQNVCEVDDKQEGL